MMPLIYFGVLAAAMIACLYLFVTTERKVARLGRSVGSIETRIGEWAGRTKEVEEAVTSLAATRQRTAASSGVNVQQRTKVLRLARKGEGAERISAELGLPKSEVDLLLKVQRAVVRAF